MRSDIDGQWKVIKKILDEHDYPNHEAGNMICFNKSQSEFKRVLSDAKAKKEQDVHLVDSGVSGKWANVKTSNLKGQQDGDSEEEQEEEDDAPNIRKEESKHPLIEESKGVSGGQGPSAAVGLKSAALYNSDDDGGMSGKKRVPKVKQIDYSLSSEEGAQVARVKEPNYDDPKFQLVKKEESKK